MLKFINLPMAMDRLSSIVEIIQKYMFPIHLVVCNNALGRPK